MESKHRKSKRSLNGKDVYELACRYDVGWSKKKQKKGDGIQDSGMDGARSENRNQTNSEEQHDLVRVKGEDTKLDASRTHDGTNSQRNVRKKRLQEVDVDSSSAQNNLEQDLHPLHTQWKFTRGELAKLKSQGVKIKLGVWSKKEINRLEKNMKMYLKDNNITDPMPLILAENGRREKDAKAKSSQTNFYRSLGKGIDRPLFHVYRRVLRMYNPKNHAGKWSEAESQELLRFHSLHGDQWTRIGSFLGRSGMSVHHRFLELQKARSGSWSEDEIERLSAAVRASTGTDFGDQICRGICWTEVSTLVMTRTADQCRGKWTRHVCWREADGERNIKWDSEDDAKLIERLYSAVETDENDIDWVSITKDLPNAPSVTWLRSKWFTLKKAVPNYTECDHEDILDYLYHKHRPFLTKIKTEDAENS